MEDASATEGLTIVTHREGDRAVVEIGGELDLHESGRLEAALMEVIRGTSEPTSVIELAAGSLTFTDSAGIRAMLVARNEADARGIEFEVTGVSAAVGRILSIAGVADLLGSD
jgi:anti-anti-sigma factor